VLIVATTRSVLTGLVLAGLFAVGAEAAPAHAVAQVDCAEAGRPARIGGTWVCVLVAGGHHDVPVQVEVAGGGWTPGRWCANPLGLGPPGFGGAPAPYAPSAAATVPCHLDQFGWWDGTGCYYHYERQAVPSDDGWGAAPDGLLYRVRCFLEDLNGFGDWFDQEERVLPGRPPFEGGAPPALLTLWEQAVNSLAMTGPEIGTAPPADQGAGVVRVPVWMWDGGAPATGPVTAGPALGRTVRARARVGEVLWDTGDGSPPVACDQGVAWEQGMDVLDPPCGHPYPRASRDQPGGTFRITATTTWHLEWWVDGVWDGELFLPATSTTEIRVDEIQVLTG
jgi:hypothetical protein